MPVVRRRAGQMLSSAAEVGGAGPRPDERHGHRVGPRLGRHRRRRSRSWSWYWRNRRVRGPTIVAATRPHVPSPDRTLPTSWSSAPAISGRVASGRRRGSAAPPRWRGGGRRPASPPTAGSPRRSNHVRAHVSSSADGGRPRQRRGEAPGEVGDAHDAITARGWASRYTCHSRSWLTLVYTCVVEIEAWPSSSWTTRRSAP